MSGEPARPDVSDTGSETAGRGAAVLLLAGFDRMASAGRIQVPGACSRSPCALPAQIGWATVVSGVHLLTKEQVSDRRRGSNQLTLKCARSAAAAAFDLAVQKGLTGGGSAG